MIFNNKKKVFLEYLFIIIGTFAMAIATNVFYEANGIAPGGITGLSIIIKSIGERFFSCAIPIWLTTIVLNAPLLICGLIINGKKFVFRTLISICLLSIMLYITKEIKIENIDMILASVYGAVLMGFGLGLVFRNGSTTGGSDLIASMINKKNKNFPVPIIMFCIDAVVISSGFLVFGPREAMYAIIAEFITSRLIGVMLEGLSFCKCVFIISDKSDEISKNILDKLHRGVTSLTGCGMYTKKERTVLFCAITEKEIILLEQIVNKFDKNAFVIVSNANEVVGNGFKNF
jgi:uncharacterized membrane-anchored protein YitT (DUF2179 family)